MCKLFCAPSSKWLHSGKMIEVASKVNVDVIITGCRGYTWGGKTFIGRMSEKVIEQVTSSVLVVEQ